MTSILTRPYPAWKACIVGLGGNPESQSDAIVPALWYGLAANTLTAGALATMPESRGAAGLTLTPASGTLAFNATTGLVTLSETLGMSSTATAIDSSSACSLAFIVAGGGAALWYGGFYPTGEFLLSGGSGFFATHPQGGTEAVSVLANTDTSLRLIIMSISGSTAYITVPGQATVSAAAGATQSPGASAFTAGSYQQSGSSALATFGAAIFWKRAVTSVTSNDVAVVEEFASTLQFVLR